jgi:hypothetical protein
MSTEYEHSDADFSDYNSFNDAEIDTYRLHERNAYDEAEYKDPAPNADERLYNDNDNAGRRSITCGFIT